MPRLPEQDLQKVTINLYRSDVASLQSHYGWGWSEQVRNLVRDFVRRRQQASDTMRGTDDREHN
jgi:hypothetical protein